MKTLEGKIVSVSMNNTVVVEVVRRTPHPLYRKLIKRSKKYKVDSNGMEAEVGKRVKIVETRPISKNKFFKLSEIIGSKTSKASAKKAVIVQDLKEEKKTVRKTVKKGSK